MEAKFMVNALCIIGSLIYIIAKCPQNHQLLDKIAQ